MDITGLEVVDAIGHAFTADFDDSATGIDLQDLASGTYILKIQTASRGFNKAGLYCTVDIEK